MTEAVYFKLISNTSSSVRMIETLELFPRGEYFFFLNQCSKYCLLSTGHLFLSRYIRELNILIHQSFQDHSESDVTLCTLHVNHCYITENAYLEYFLLLLFIKGRCPSNSGWEQSSSWYDARFPPDCDTGKLEEGKFPAELGQIVSSRNPRLRSRGNQVILQVCYWSYEVL